MKTLQLLLLAFVCMGTWASPTHHTGMLEGHVSDESDGQALIGVSIYFPELKEGTITNSEGNYSIDNLPAVKTTVQVSYVGHQTIIREVDLRTTSHIDFTMKEANATLSEVVVTGLTGTELVSNSPSPVSIVSPRELMATASTNIIDALSKQPGVAQITTGGGISKPVIRGLGYNRVLVVSDGIRQEGQQWGDEHGIEIDAQRVHTVEILKGPATLVYGSDAMAGVLIFHDDPIMPRNTMEANVGTEYQTNNGLFGYTADFTGNRDGWVWNWRWSQKMAHDYKNRYDGYVANSRFQERALSGLLGTNRNWGYSHLKLSYYHLTPGIVEGERDATTGELIREGGRKSYSSMMPYQQIHHYKAVWDNSLLIGDGAMKMLIGYQQNRRQEVEEHHHHHHSEAGEDHDHDEDDHEDEGEDHDHEEDGHEEEGLCGLDFRLHTVNYDVHYQTGEWNGWKSAFGIGGMYQRSENLGDEFLIPAYNLFDVGVFATTCRDFGHWHVSGGLRYDTRHLHSHSLWTEEDGQRFKAFSRNFSGLTGSLGAICNLTDQANLRINVSRGFRAPNLSELGSNGTHHGTLRYELGNRELSPEFSWQLDLGFDFSSPIVSMQVALFANFISDYIFAKRLQNPPTTIDNHETPVYHYTQGDARIVGGELSVDIHPVEPLHFENTFSYVNSIQTDQPKESKYLPFTPAPRWLSTLRYDFIRDGHTLNNTFAAVEMDCNMKQDRFYGAYSTETATPAFTLFNIMAGTDVKSHDHKVATVMLFANNVFDCNYQNHLSRLKYADINLKTGRTGIYNMGRNIGIKVNVPISL